MGMPLGRRQFASGSPGAGVGLILDLFGIDDAAQDWRALERFMREMGPQPIASVRELGLTRQ